MQTSEVSDIEENIEDLPENQSRVRTRKRKEKRQKQTSKLINYTSSPTVKEPHRLTPE